MIHIRPTAKLDDKQRRIIFAIQPYTIGQDIEVTRGHTDPLGQLYTIESLANQHGVEFSEFESGKLYYREEDQRIEGTVYPWQRMHSRLLLLGVIVNPPMICRVLEHYIRTTGEDMFGELMNPSPHIISDPIDFSSKVNGMSDIDGVVGILAIAKAEGVGIRNIKPEPANGCVHIDLEKLV